MLSLGDEIFNLIQECEPLAKPKYNKYYIGIERNGVAANFAWIKPKKSFVRLMSKFIPDEEFKEKIDNAGIDLEFNSKWNESQLKLTDFPKEPQLSLVKEFISRGHQNYDA